MRSRALLSFIAALAFSLGAIAAPIVPTEDNDGLPDLNDAFNQIAGTAFASNAGLVPLRLSDAADQLFKVSSTDVAVIGLTASNSNTLGYYDDPGVGASRFPTATSFSGFGFLGAGTAASPYPGVMLSPDPGSSTIGIFLDSVSGPTTNTFFSEPSLNSDGLDHVIAYDASGFVASINSQFVDFGSGAQLLNLTNPILIGFEDLVGGGDSDFDDTIFLVDLVTIPEPTSLLLLGVGMLALGLARRGRH